MKQVLKNLPIQSTLNIINSFENNVLIKNVNDDYQILHIAMQYLKQPDNYIFVLNNMYNASKAYDKLVELLGSKCVSFYPADEFITSELLATSNEFKRERLNTIYGILDESNKIIVTHISGLLKPTIPKSNWQTHMIKLNIGKIINRNLLIQNFVELGYERVNLVEDFGEFAIRGSIIDIYPINYERPIRLDFFDDEIDEIRFFNYDNQRSIERCEDVIIYPYNEFFYNEQKLEKAKNILQNFVDNSNLTNKGKAQYNYDISCLNDNNETERVSKYIKYFYDDIHTIIDLACPSKIFYSNFDKITEVYDTLIKDIESIYEGNDKTYNLFDFIYIDDLYVNIGKPFNKVVFQTLLDIKYDKSIVFDNMYNIYAREVSLDGNNISEFTKEIKKLNDYIILLFVEDQSRLKNIINFLLDYKIKYDFYDETKLKKGTIYLVNQLLNVSVDLYEDKFILLSEEKLFTRNVKKTAFRGYAKESKKINSISSLNVGDYLVHYDYGIGIFKGFETVELNNVKNDYILMEYKNGASLYVPIDKISRVHKYSTSEGAKPKLSKLGGSDWAKTKARVKSQIKDIAENLLKLYRERENRKGFKYSFDTSEQLLFESNFEYEETEDQLKAINDVKSDMESDKPMDRLVCGDVGFGKTEIAMRAAFKAVMDGKQVAYLAPTTVLSRQHYYTFKNRFEQFGVNLGLLNRFVKKSNQTKVIQKVKNGLIDILIGTHRILSKDIQYKDLGLLIVDEEQRFGVEHKEKIKELKSNIDVITLTATPIPRTLQMSLSGVKKMSVLNTPPKNRYPIQTYVLEDNDIIIREAIEREVARNGQIYFLFNKVIGIEEQATKIKKLVPEANVTFAHGQMSRDELEERVQDFIDGKYNALVCTTIIETGIDISNANTLIVTDSDKLGLSQLYQIRGRVGRSDRIAYAYLLYKKNKTLNDNAIKRLKAIKDFTELGSGYKIALRDLTIRGAGDILGSQQSGFIDTVGFDMFLDMLNDEVGKNQGKTEEIRNNINLDVSRYIPSDYIPDNYLKVELHKKISDLKSVSDLDVLKEEFEDRFGRVHNDVYIYMHEKLFNYMQNILGVEKVVNDRSKVRIVFDKDKGKDLNIKLLGEITNSISKEIVFEYKNNRLNIKLNEYVNSKHWVEYINLIFDSYLNRLN